MPEEEEGAEGEEHREEEEDATAGARRRASTPIDNANAPARHCYAPTHRGLDSSRRHPYLLRAAR